MVKGTIADPGTELSSSSTSASELSICSLSLRYVLKERTHLLLEFSCIVSLFMERMA